eukprot:4531671-Alexandrium_andersonii.AAC.1
MRRGRPSAGPPRNAGPWRCYKQRQRCPRPSARPTLRLRRGAPSLNRLRLSPIYHRRARRATVRTASTLRTTTCIVLATRPGVPVVRTCALAFHAAALSARTHAGNAPKPVCAC